MAELLTLQGRRDVEHPRHPPLLNKGFRPFFLLAALFAVLTVPAWILTLLGALHPGGYFVLSSWHAHEMIFGFATAVLAGFLLTAVGNWTQRETAVGAPLAGLAALWLAGRIAVTFSDAFPRWLPPVADLSFLPAVMITLARPLIASKNRRNLVMLLILGALFLTNLAMHLGALGMLANGQRRGSLVAVDIVVFVLLLMAGRVFPMFTRNAISATNAAGAAAIRSIPWLDAVTLGCMALFVALDAAAPDLRVTAALAGATAVLAVARSVQWGARYGLREPLVGILHVGYAWIPFGLFLRALSAFTGAVPSSVATHALTAGAIGALTLGMMARVSLGHTGRILRAPRIMLWAFVAITGGAAMRVLGPWLLPLYYRAEIVAAGVAWSAAFGVYMIAYAPMLLTARVDGKPG